MALEHSWNCNVVPLSGEDARLGLGSAVMRIKPRDCGFQFWARRWLPNPENWELGLMSDEGSLVDGSLMPSVGGIIGTC